MYYSEKVLSRDKKNPEILTKLFTWPDTGNHLIMIARGPIDVSGFEVIFREICDTTQSLANCKVLIDLQDATYALEPVKIDAFINELHFDLWSDSNRVALVTRPETNLSNQLFMLSDNLSNRGLKVAVFYNSKDAVVWLAEGVARQ